MNTNTQPSPYCLDHVSNEDLHAGTRRLVGRSNQVLAALLAHLAELEARGIHRQRACPSLINYCIYELRMSEDEAFRRVQAARIARKFPILLSRVAAGEIHLTGVLLLGPHLTEENQLEALARAKHRTKKEITRLVRMLDPLPNVPAVIEPLGPVPIGLLAPRDATWRRMATACAGPVRELEPDDRPKDWMDPGDDDLFDTPKTAEVVDEVHRSERADEAACGDVSGGRVLGGRSRGREGEVRADVPEDEIVGRPGAR
jgi:hypothetical protein